MIDIKNISFSYKNGKPVLDKFSLKLSENDRICLFGKSGCGKTTVLRILAGLETPQKGTISGLSGKRPSVVFQEDRLLPFMTVLENIMITGADRNKASATLSALGIADCENKYPDSLSGGMQRRVSLARALASDFDFLLLDEAFNGLDENNISGAAEYIKEILCSRPLVMVSHSQGEAQLLGADILNM